MTVSNFERLKRISFVPKGLNRYNGCRDLLEFSFLSNFGVVSREDFINVGKFDEGYTGWGYEETDLMFRLLLDGIKFKSLYSMIDVLHLNHPLGESESHLTAENRERYHAKTHEKGVIFKVNHLFGVFEDDGKEILQKFIYINKNIEYHNMSEQSSNCDNKEPSPIHQAANSNDIDISIIIPTYNSFELRRGSIELTLAALEKQTNSKFEVVVVDDGSDDQTLDFLKYYSSRVLPFPFRFIHLNHSSNRSKSRNIGANEARGELLLFLDDDTIFLSDNDIDKIIRLYRPGYFMCGAKRYWTYVTWDRQSFIKAIKTYDFSTIQDKYFLPCGINRRKGFRDLFEYSFLSNCGIVSKTAFEKVGGFDEITFDGWGREDVDLMLRLYLNKVHFFNLHDYISVLHLNHPIRQEDAKKREYYFEKYEESEKKYGYIFKVNHLFGVFENDGTDILIPIGRKEVD